MKQLGLAALNYESAFQRFPSRQAGTGTIRTGEQRCRQSGFTAILPFIEQNALYELIQQQNGAQWGGFYRDNGGNLSFLQCPSDPGSGSQTDPNNRAGRGTTSYAMNAGDCYARSAFAERSERDDASITIRFPRIDVRGLFGRHTYYKIGAITDGTSNTAAFAERRVPTAQDGKGMVYWTAGARDAYIPLLCRSQWVGNRYADVNVRFRSDTQAGYRWADAAAFFHAFTTILPPNTAVCLLGDSDRWQATGGHYGPGIWTPSSEHTGGVQVSFADGSVHFISQNIDTGNLGLVAPDESGGGPSPYGVWGALGTRAAGEVSTSLE